MAKKKDIIKTVVNKGAIVAKQTKKAPEQGAISAPKQKNIQSAQGNTSNAYGKPSKSTNPKLNHSTEFSRPTQPAFQLEHGIANPIKKVPSLDDYDPMPVEYGYKEDKAARERKKSVDTVRTASKAGTYGAVAPFLPQLQKMQEEQANQLREAQKSGNTRLKYNGRSDEKYTTESVMDGAQKHAKVTRTGGIDINNLQDYSDEDIFRALGDYQLDGSFINNALSNGRYVDENGRVINKTPEDYNIYNAIYNEWKRRQGNEDENKELYDRLTAFSESNPRLAHALSFGPSLLRGTDAIQQRINRELGRPINDDGNGGDMLSMSQITDALRSGSPKDSNEITRFIQGVVESIGDSAINRLLGPAGMVNMGLGASAASTQDALDRGIDPNRALAMGTLSGATEAATEMFELEALTNAFKGGNVRTVKDLLTNMGKQAVNEGASEGVSEILGSLTDSAIAGELSKYNLAVQAYMAQGMSREQAESQATMDIANDVGLSTLGGALSGLGFGGLGSGVDYAYNRINDARQVNALKEAAKYQDAFDAMNSINNEVPALQRIAEEQKANQIESLSDYQNAIDEARAAQNSDLNALMEQYRRLNQTPVSEVANNAPEQTEQLMPEVRSEEPTVENNAKAIAEEIKEPTLTETLPKETAPKTVEETPQEFGKFPSELLEEANQKPESPKETYTSRTITNTAVNSFLQRTNEGIELLRDFKDTDKALGRVDKVSNAESLKRAAERLGPDGENINAERERLLNLHDKEFSGTDLDESMMIIESDLQNGNIEGGARLLRLITEKSHLAGQSLQALAKYSRTASGTLAKGQRMVDNVVRSFEKTHQGQVKADTRTAEALTKLEKNQKLASALRGMGDDTAQVPKLEKTHEQLIDEIKNTLADEYAVSSNKFNDADYEFIARMIEGGYSTKELRQALTTKMATGTWGITDEDVQFVLDKFNKAEEAGLDSREASNHLTEAYARLAEKLGEEGTFLDKWNSWRYLAMLGNTRTHIRNIIGNTLFGTVTNLKDALAAVGEAGVNKLSKNGIERTKSILNLASQADQDLIKGADQYFEHYAYAPATEGGNKYNDIQNEIQRQKQIWEKNGLEKYIGMLDELNSKLLTGEDNFAIKRKYKTALASYLKANKKTADIFNMNSQEDIDFLQKASEYAIKQAQIATFHEDNAFADWLNAVERQAKNNPLLRVGVETIGEGLIPFKKTPANILKQGMRYSPVGTVGIVYKGIQNLVDAKNGNEFRHSASEFINDISEVLTGSMIMGLGMLLTSKGILKPSSDDEDKDQVLGEQTYSLNFGPHSYTIDWTAPAGIPLFIGAELYKSMQDDGEIDPVLAISRAGGPVIEMSMLQGIRDTINNMIEPFKYGNAKEGALADALGSAALTPVLNYVGQGLPTALGQVARSVDETRRSSYTPETGFEKTWNKWLLKQQNKIPFLSENSEPYINSFGETEENPGGNIIGRLAYNMLSPGYYSRKKEGPLISELERLSEVPEVQQEGTNVFPDAYASSRPLGSGTEKIDRQEYTRYSKSKGQNVTQMLSELINSPVYKNASDLEKAQMVTKVKSFADALAKDENFVDYDISGNSTYKKQYEIYKDGGGLPSLLDYYKEKSDFDNAGVSHNKYTDAAYEKGEEEFNRATEVVNELKEYGYDTGNKKAVEAAENGTLDEYAEKDALMKSYGLDNMSTFDIIPSLDDYKSYANVVKNSGLSDNKTNANLFKQKDGTFEIASKAVAPGDKDGVANRADVISYLKKQGYSIEEANKIVKQFGWKKDISKKEW